MKRTLLFVVLSLLLAAPAIAITGPSDSGNFEIFLRELPSDDPNSDEYFRDAFTGKGTSGTGWSFGDRLAYACAFIEHYTSNTLDFEVHYEVLIGAGYEAGDLEINDRFGAQQQQGPCGDGIGPGASLQYNEAVHGDHFPHGDFFATEQVSDLVAYRDADADGFVQADDEIRRVDYSNGDPCDSWYWTPGRDADGTPAAIGWWDEDGPSSPDGHQSLNCPGNGELTPAPAILVTFKDVAPNVVVCVNELEGPVCEGGSFGEPPPPITPVTLGSGTSELTCPDGSNPAVVQSDPLQVVCP